MTPHIQLQSALFSIFQIAHFGNTVPHGSNAQGEKVFVQLFSGPYANVNETLLQIMQYYQNSFDNKMRILSDIFYFFNLRFFSYFIET